MNEILFAHNLKSHVRRDFTITGVKILDSVNQGLLFIHGFGDRGIACTERMLAFVIDSASTTQPDALTRWIDDLAALSQWKSTGHGPKLYSSGKIANETEIARIIGYGSASSPGSFRWTK
jgi:hypothetical protein